MSLDQAKAAAAYGQLPLAFEVNAGQTDPRVKFLSRNNPRLARVIYS